MSEIKPLTGHVSEETAFVVDDYPYGFRLRCKIRYWVEAHKTHGFRNCSQTTNPKVPGERWNKPKKGTYCKIACGMFQTVEDGHVHFCGLSEYSDLKESEAFLEKYRECMNADAIENLEVWIRLKRIYEAKRDAALAAREASNGPE